MNQQQEQTRRSGSTKHTGGCHCGAVRFEVELEPNPTVSRCNCSICTKLASTTSIVKPQAFTLLSSSDALGTYEWGGKTGRRHFCKQCGVHCFGPGYLEQLGGDYVSVNMNTLDDVDPNQLTPVYWDGRHDNWQAGPRSTAWPIFEGPRS
jgi:hypothetical protein